MRTANNPPAIVMKAFTWAYEELGLSSCEASQLLGISETALRQTALVGFEGDSPESEIQVAFIRMYHLLYTMSDGDTDLMIDWFTRHNPHLGVVPKEACHNLAGISYISDYLQSEQAQQPLTDLSVLMSLRQGDHQETVAVAR